MLAYCENPVMACVMAKAVSC